MSLNPKSLRLFVSTIRHGSIADAAVSEHLAPSALSRRISELETSVGTPLLIRSNKGVAATPAGRALVHLAHRVLNDLADIEVQMREFSSGVSGYVSVFANISAMTQFLPPDLKKFLSRHPKVQIHLEQRISSEVAQAVLANEADVGVLVSDEVHSNLTLLPYRTDRLVLLVAKSHALASKSSVRLGQTWQYDYVGLPPGSQINTRLIRAAQEDGHAWRCRFHVPSYDVLVLMVEAGLGIGVLPERIARGTAGVDVRVIELAEPWTSRKLSLCIRDEASLSPSARLLVQEMQGRDTQAPE